MTVSLEERLTELEVRFAFVEDAVVALNARRIASIRASVDNGAHAIGKRGLLVNKVVIPQPRPELLNEMI